MRTVNHRIEDIAFRVRGKPTGHLVSLQHHGRGDPSKNKKHKIPILIFDA